jgi:hypothetical protein
MAQNFSRAHAFVLMLIAALLVGLPFAFEQGRSTERKRLSFHVNTLSASLANETVFPLRVPSESEAFAALCVAEDSPVRTTFQWDPVNGFSVRPKPFPAVLGAALTRSAAYLLVTLAFGGILLSARPVARRFKLFAQRNGEVAVPAISPGLAAVASLCFCVAMAAVTW